MKDVEESNIIEQEQENGCVQKTLINTNKGKEGVNGPENWVQKNNEGQEGVNGSDNWAQKNSEERTLVQEISHVVEAQIPLFIEIEKEPIILIPSEQGLMSMVEESSARPETPMDIVHRDTQREEVGRYHSVGKRILPSSIAPKKINGEIQREEKMESVWG